MFKVEAALALQLLTTKGVGYKSVWEFFKTKYENDYRINNDQDIVELFKIIHSQNKRIKIPTLDSLDSASNGSEDIIDKSDHNDIKIIEYGSNDYPQLLYGIKKPPLLLHTKGNLESIDKNPTVAVVGTREPSNYGTKVGKKVSDILTNESEFTIVSGLASGCDTIAHKSAVKNNIPTIAVLAGGLHNIYPKENENLGIEILEKGGLLISELSFGSNPNRSTFVERNRIQSGLSYGTVVIQTDIKGGTMHTAKFTLEQERILACIYPDSKGYNVNKDEKYEGNRNLIEKGAWKITDGDDLQFFIEKINSRYRGFHGLNHKISNVNNNNVGKQLNIFLNGRYCNL